MIEMMGVSANSGAGVRLGTVGLRHDATHCEPLTRLDLHMLQAYIDSSSGQNVVSCADTYVLPSATVMNYESLFLFACGF